MSIEKNMVPVSDDTAATPEQEVNQAMAVAEDSQAYTHRFRTPFSYEGKTYTELIFDFGKLTGKDGLDIEAEIQALGRPVIIPSLSGEYLLRMAARACTTRIGFDVLKAMPLSEYNRIRSASRNFLISAEL